MLSILILEALILLISNLTPDQKEGKDIFSLSLLIWPNLDHSYHFIH